MIVITVKPHTMRHESGLLELVYSPLSFCFWVSDVQLRRSGATCVLRDCDRSNGGTPGVPIIPRAFPTNNPLGLTSCDFMGIKVVINPKDAVPLE